MLHPRVAAFVAVHADSRDFEEHDAMVSLVVADERHGGKRRPALRFGRQCRTMVDRHAEHLAVPVEHRVQIARGQAVVQQLWMDGDLGIHLPACSSLRKTGRKRTWTRQELAVRWNSLNWLFHYNE